MPSNGRQLHYLDKYGNNYGKNNYVYYNQINWLENKMCHLTDDSCRSPSIYIHYIGDGFYTVDNKTQKVILVIETATFRVKDSICTLPACFHAACQLTNTSTPALEHERISTLYATSGQAAIWSSASKALNEGSNRFLLLNNGKIRQFLVDWRAKHKSSRRTGVTIIAIKNSPGLIGGRLEPQRGRLLTVKAVCGGTLGWKDPPFNSILTLPGTTQQDPTLNEIIKNKITKITINQHIIKLYEYRNLKVIIRTLPTTNGNDLTNPNTNELALTTSPSTKTEQVPLRRKLRCQKKLA